VYRTPRPRLAPPTRPRAVPKTVASRLNHPPTFGHGDRSPAGAAGYRFGRHAVLRAAWDPRRGARGQVGASPCARRRRASLPVTSTRSRPCSCAATTCCPSSSCRVAESAPRRLQFAHPNGRCHPRRRGNLAEDREAPLLGEAIHCVLDRGLHLEVDRVDVLAIVDPLWVLVDVNRVEQLGADLRR